jgi:hypothetical protein
MIRTALGVLVAVVAPVLITRSVGAVVGYAPTPMFWSRANEYAFFTVLLLGTAVGAFAGVHMTRRGLVAAGAVVLSLAVSYDWCRIGSATGLVVAVALLGVVGAYGGGLLAWRRLGPTGTDAAA